MGIRPAELLGTAAFCLCAQTLRRLGLDLSRLARLDVVTAAPDLAQDSGFHHTALEALQRPVDAICFGQVDFDHRSSTGRDEEAPRCRNRTVPDSAAPIRPRRARAAVFSGRAS